ncbi:MAG TPA: endonuclease III [Ignavibacteriaceae bacterium]|nr:endonuclease III [Ignavibacteriaceae bacterium]
MNKKEQQRAKKIFDILKDNYPIPKTFLNHTNPFELLIATILSAQCTDARVNQVTETLFKKYKIPQDYLAASNEEIEKEIYSLGFYSNKTKSIKKCSKALIENYNGNVPEDFDELTKLPGVGRKTASVVAGNVFMIPSIAVDTHVIRLSNLLGFVETKDPEKIETRLKELLPEADWINSSHYLIMHGRNICVARKPKCLECPLDKLCPSYLYYLKDVKNDKQRTK